jgi:hypothetical protein
MVVMEPYALLGSPYKVTNDAGPVATYDPAVWSVSTSYVQGDTSRVDGTVNKVYEALVDVTGGSSPEIDVLSATPKWAEIRYTNKYCCFDYTRNSFSSTSNTSGGRTTMVVQVTTGIRFDSLFVLGLNNIDEVVINGTSPTQGDVYNVTRSNLLSSLEDHIDLFDIPPITDLVLTITLKAASGNTDPIYVHHISVGKAVYIGDIQTNNKMDNVNYSVVTRDEFGVATLVPRRSILKLDFTLFAESKYADKIALVRESLNAVPAVWYAMEDSNVEEYNNVCVMLGIYKNFRLQLDNPYSITINLELEEI